jgi:hypothetical protein
MPYPESCPECASTFRNTGTHFTARRNEVGRHVLLELGCQTTNRRFWWDFTTGQLAGVAGAPAPQASDSRVLAAAGVAAAPGTAASLHTNGSNGHTSNGSHVGLTQPRPTAAHTPDGSMGSNGTHPAADVRPTPEAAPAAAQPEQRMRPSLEVVTSPIATPAPISQRPKEEPVDSTPADRVPQDQTGVREAFLRQLQLDRLTMRQMRGWLMAEEARRAAEVAASATEATYERLALALFGADLPQLLGRAAAVPPSTTMSAEERLELQREKARIRARQRRAAIKAARLARED